MFICRHGQTVWNEEWRLQWRSDSDLTQAGKIQSIRIGEILKDIVSTDTTIYSSPLRRATDTSKIIANTLGLSHDIIQQDELLTEMSFWDHEWLTHSQREQWALAADLKSRELNPYKNALTWWENYNQVLQRAQEFLKTIKPCSLDIIVAHSAFNKMLLRAASGLPADEALKISHPNDVIYKVDKGAVFHKTLWKEWDWKEWIHR